MFLLSVVPKLLFLGSLDPNSQSAGVAVSLRVAPILEIETKSDLNVVILTVFSQVA